MPSTQAHAISTCCSASGSDIDLYLLDSSDQVVGSSAAGTDQVRMLAATPPDGQYTILGLGMDAPGGVDTFDLTIQIINSVGADLQWEFTAAPETCAATGDVSWLDVLTGNGIIIAGSASSPLIRFDPTGLSSGLYTGPQCITSNDPVTPLVQAPVSLLLRLLYLPFIIRP